MADFYTSVSEVDMASQIAVGLNTYNQWASSFSAQALMMTPARYFVELERSQIVGCASHIRECDTLSKIQHIYVLPRYRGMGIAKKLTNMAIMYCETELVYMTIREDNMASLALAKSLNFIHIKRHWFRDHWTLTFGRRRDNDHRSYAGKV